jgi:hypothetical protein
MWKIGFLLRNRNMYGLAFREEGVTNEHSNELGVGLPIEIPSYHHGFVLRRHYTGPGGRGWLYWRFPKHDGVGDMESAVVPGI